MEKHRSRESMPEVASPQAAIILKACLEYAAGQAATAGFARAAQIVRLAISAVDEEVVPRQIVGADLRAGGTRL